VVVASHLVITLIALHLIQMSSASGHSAITPLPVDIDAIRRDLAETAKSARMPTFATELFKHALEPCIARLDRARDKPTGTTDAPIQAIQTGDRNKIGRKACMAAFVATLMRHTPGINIAVFVRKAVDRDSFTRCVSSRVNIPTIQAVSRSHLQLTGGRRLTVYLPGADCLQDPQAIDVLIVMSAFAMSEKACRAMIPAMGIATVILMDTEAAQPTWGVNQERSFVAGWFGALMARKLPGIGTVNIERSVIYRHPCESAITHGTGNAGTDKKTN
jgi:hypothetical protein